MLELLGTIFGSIFSGGATGLIGVAVQRWADYKNRQLDIQVIELRGKQELAMRDKDAEISRQEWAGRTRVAETEAAGKSDVAASEAFAASFKSEPERYAESSKLTPGQTWAMVVLDWIRGFVRPFLTLYLCALTTGIYFQAKGLITGNELTDTDAMALVKLIVSTILYLFTTVVLWYFGTRNRQAPPKV